MSKLNLILLIGSSTAFLAMIIFIMFRRRRKPQSESEKEYNQNVLWLTFVVFLCALLGLQLGMIGTNQQVADIHNIEKLDSAVIRAVDKKIDSINRKIDRITPNAPGTGGLPPDLNVVTQMLTAHFERTENLIKESCKGIHNGTAILVNKPKIKAGYLILGIALALAGAFLLFGFIAKNNIKAGIGGILFTAGSLISAKEIFKLSLELPDININSKKLKCDCECKGGTSSNKLAYIGEIGPFKDGYDVLINDDGKQWKKIKDSLQENRYSVLHIFGGVDKRRLIGKARQIFGDNLTLSKARSKYLKKLIDGYKNDNTIGFEFKPESIFIYPEGAEYYTDHDSSSLARDRMVRIFGTRIE